MLNWWKTKRPKALTNWIELILLALFAIWVTRPYLNMDPRMWPVGNEFASSVQNNFIWNYLFKCGTCMLWNGGLNGGAPAFAELQGSILHPVTVLTTLIWGVTNGAKVALTLTFIMAGWAQWWIAKTLKLGWIARIWSGALAIVGGQLSGRMELGTGALSVAACTLIIAPGISAALKGRKRDIILFGGMVALALLSGGGYMQSAMFIAMIPAFLIFIVDARLKITSALKNFAIAAGLAIMLSAIFWVPMLHLYPSIFKDTDPNYANSQPLAYEPLNLVISDYNFQYNDSLNKAPYPVLNTTYIGWVPVLLAILAFRAPKTKEEFKVFVFFLLSILLIYLTSSAVLLKALAKISPQLAGVRFSSILATMAVPYIIALSAWGVDWLIHKAWPELTFKTDTVNLKLSTGLLMAIPLIWALVSCYKFGRTWIAVQPVSPDLWHVAEKLETPTTEWVNFPYGEHFWMIPGLDLNIKIGRGISHWKWKGRDFPAAAFDATRDAVDTTAPNFQGQVFGINIVSHPEVNYAYIVAGDQKIPCEAHAMGGNIDVTCDSSISGQLVVMENTFQGWTAKIDGKSTGLLPYQYWLSVKAPSGKHTYTFRYLPWDVPVGLAITLIGIGVVIWWAFFKGRKFRAVSPKTVVPASPEVQPTPEQPAKIES